MVLSLSLGGFAALASLALVNILFGALVLGALLTRAPFWQVPGFRIGLVFTAWCTFTAILGALRGEPTGHYHFAWGWLFVPFIWCAGQVAMARRAALVGVAVALGLAAVAGLLQWTLGFTLNANVIHLDPEGTRFDQVAGISNRYIRYGPVALFLAALLTLRQYRHVIQFGGLLAAGLGLILTMARMAILGANVAIIGSLATLYRHLRRRTVIAILLVTIIPIVAAVILTPDKVDRAFKFEDGRFIIWHIAADIIREQPVVGLGSDNAFRHQYELRWPAVAEAWPTPLPVVEPTHVHAHNTVIGLATTSGLLAPLLYLGWIARLFFAVRAASDPHTVFAGTLLLLAWLAVGMFEHMARAGSMTMAFGLSIGVILAVCQPRRTPS